MELKFTLELTLDDRKARVDSQEELQQLRAAISATGVTFIPFSTQPGRILNFPSLDLLCRFALDHADKAIPALTGLLGAWVGSRNGRKARVRIGDLEAEARTPQEVEQLLERALEVQSRHEPKRIHEP